MGFVLSLLHKPHTFLPISAPQFHRFYSQRKNPIAPPKKRPIWTRQNAADLKAVVLKHKNAIITSDLLNNDPLFDTIPKYLLSFKLAAYYETKRMKGPWLVEEEIVFVKYLISTPVDLFGWQKVFNFLY
jgi:hypothetical protein